MLSVATQGTAEASRAAVTPKILIIDDSQATAGALEHLLRRASYDTAVAHRGQDGIERARAGGFAAAMVDIHLPDLSGLVVSQKLRELLGPNTPIIVLSGDTSMQTLNPRAAANTDPVFGMDGRSATAAMDRYDTSFQTPQRDANAYRVGVGSSNTLSSMGR